MTTLDYLARHVKREAIVKQFPAQEGAREGWQADTPRYLLVQRNVHPTAGGAHWFHEADTLDEIVRYIAGEENPEDWHNVAVFDLDTGRCARIQVRAVIEDEWTDSLYGWLVA